MFAGVRSYTTSIRHHKRKWSPACRFPQFCPIRLKMTQPPGNKLPGRLINCPFQSAFTRLRNRPEDEVRFLPELLLE